MALQVGEALREARVGRGLDLDEVERVTKIREKYLRAMEEDRWDALPAPAYARGFLSTYARFLGLDERPLIDQYVRERPPAEELDPIPETMLPKRGEVRRRPSVRLVAILAGVVAGLVAVGIVTLTDGGEEGDGEERAATTTEASTEATTTTEPPEVTIELQSTADVWVCLVRADGEPLVNGEILTANEERGPFRAGGFDVSFGNGSIEMTVEEEAVEVPAAAEPLGYRITPEGVQELAEAARPTCA